MKHKLICLIAILKLLPSDCIILVVPEDVPTGLVAIYGFTPRIVKGKDHRFGFGFRFGNHADFQVMYELGPQTITRPIQPLRARSALYSERIVKRRPLIDLLLRIGLLKEASLGYDVTYDEKDDEPR